MSGVRGSRPRRRSDASRRSPARSNAHPCPLCATFPRITDGRSPANPAGGSLISETNNSPRDGAIATHLRALYGIERAPSDTCFHERFDEVQPSQLRPLYDSLSALLQRGKGLEGFDWLDGHYLLSLDGSGYCSSKTVHCPHYGETHDRDGTVI